MNKRVQASMRMEASWFQVWQGDGKPDEWTEEEERIIRKRLMIGQRVPASGPPAKVAEEA